MIEQLQYRNAISITKEIPTPGHNPLLVISDDYEEYFVKSCKNTNPPCYIISEFLCHYFAKLWGIGTPDIAAIKVQSGIINGLSIHHKPNYYDRICFGSKKIPDAIEMNDFFESKKQVDYRKFFSPASILKMGLFDIWVENDDRKPANTNIIFAPTQGKLTILAIDHAYTFNSMNYKDLNPSLGISNTSDQSILQTSFAKEIHKKVASNKQQWIKDMEKSYYICIAKCEQYFDTIVNNVPKELGFDKNLQADIRNFLFNIDRIKKVFQEFIIRIQ